MIAGAGRFHSDRSCHNAGKGGTTPDGCHVARVDPDAFFRSSSFLRPSLRLLPDESEFIEPFDAIL